MGLLVLLLRLYLNASAVLCSLGNSYRDILHCDKKPFYLKGQEEDSSILDAYIMHSVRACPLPILGWNQLYSFLIDCWCLLFS